MRQAESVIRISHGANANIKSRTSLSRWEWDVYLVGIGLVDEKDGEVVGEDNVAVGTPVLIGADDGSLDSVNYWHCLLQVPCGEAEHRGDHK